MLASVLAVADEATAVVAAAVTAVVAIVVALFVIAAAATLLCGGGPSSINKSPNGFVFETVDFTADDAAAAAGLIEPKKSSCNRLPLVLIDGDDEPFDDDDDFPKSAKPKSLIIVDWLVVWCVVYMLFIISK